MTADVGKQALIDRVRQAVPEGLRELPVWLLHDENKIPIYASGKNRRGTLDSPEDRAQLVEFEAAAVGLLKCPRAVGLGVALGAVPGTDIILGGIDLDDCLVGGKLREPGASVLAATRSYAEKSPSGDGLHILGYGGNMGIAEVIQIDGQKCEIYSSSRYFTMTGERLNGAAFVDLADTAALARKLYHAASTSGAASSTPRPAETPLDPDNRVVAAIKAARLYLRYAGDGKHLMRCPWEALHTPDRDGNRKTSDSEAAYFQPGATVRGGRHDRGTFKCQHTSHCKKRKLKDLLEYFDLAPSAATEEPPAVGEAAAVSDGAGLLNEVRAFVKRFCVFPDEHCLNAVTLWAAHAHMVQHSHTTPRLAVLSPEASSGKTRVLEVLDLLVPESLFSLNASPAAVFRTLANKQITLLFDEADAIWNRRGQDDNHEDLRALLNAGYKRGATIPRCVGPRHDVQHFPVFCAVALAGIGDLPDTIMSRAIILRMRRRAPDEPVESFRSRIQEPEGHELRGKLASWAVSVGLQAGRSEPELPPGIVDRSAEVWEPPIAIADQAGGEWPELARKACVELCKVSQERRMSLGIRLLADLRIIFEKAGNPDAIHTETIVGHLADGEEHGLEADAPWGDLHGKPLAKRGLASMLAKYGVRPTKVTIGGRSLQGYRLEHLWDAWGRYLPPLSATTASPELPELPASQAGNHSGRPIPDAIPGADADPELPERSVSAAAASVPAIPGIPENRQGEGASDGGTTVCRACDGEGCRWCRGQPSRHASASWVGRGRRDG